MLTVQADFTVADDMLREACHRRLAAHGQIVLQRAGRIGPIVEVSLASLQLMDQYRTVEINGGFAANLHQALQTGQPFGSDYHDVAGAFPLGTENPVVVASALWEQWVLHAENVAKMKGLNAQLVASLIGAMGEIQDNVYEHSNAPQTGLVAYAVTSNSFEFVVADRGLGVLQTLRQNPDYADIADAGAALREVIKEGVSRFPAEMGRGQGFNQLFRGLVGHSAELRFRSGDHALTMRPTSDALHGETVLAQVAPLKGFTVSVFHRVNGA